MRRRQPAHLDPLPEGLLMTRRSPANLPEERRQQLADRVAALNRADDAMRAALTVPDDDSEDAK
ncbi:hypothetical protein ACWEPC_59165 [Nonomuraea sp. NPDC004297]